MKTAVEEAHKLEECLKEKSEVNPRGKRNSSTERLVA